MLTLCVLWVVWIPRVNPSKICGKSWNIHICCTLYKGAPYTSWWFTFYKMCPTNRIYLMIWDITCKVRVCCATISDLLAVGANICKHTWPRDLGDVDCQDKAYYCLDSIWHTSFAILSSNRRLRKSPIAVTRLFYTKQTVEQPYRNQKLWYVLLSIYRSAYRSNPRMNSKS